MPTSTKIKKFNKVNLAIIAMRIQEAIKPVAEEFGIDLKDAGGSFDDTNFTFRLKGALIVEDAEGNTVVETEERSNFRLYAGRFGLEESDLGREFSNGEDTFEIIGLKPRASKYPILGRNVLTQKRYKFSAAKVRHLLLRTD
jgi:hypothetical protein